MHPNKSAHPLATWVAIVLMLLPMLPAAAQDLPVLMSGDYVRIRTTQKDRHLGHVLSSTADSLIITAAGSTIGVSRSAVRRIDFGLGPTPWHAAKIGAVIGMTGGLIYTISWMKGVEPSGFPSVEAVILPLVVGTNMVVGGAIGFGLGLGIGLANPAQRWVRVYPRPANVQFIGAPRGARGAGLRITLQ
jgi:hypothetical protein